MSQLEKLLQRIHNNPKTVRVEELAKILLKNNTEECAVCKRMLCQASYRSIGSRIRQSRRKPALNGIEIQ